MEAEGSTSDAAIFQCKSEFERSRTSCLTLAPFDPRPQGRLCSKDRRPCLGTVMVEVADR